MSQNQNTKRHSLEQKGKNTGYGSTKRFSGEKLFREPASFPSLDPYFGSFGQLQNLESPSQPFLPTLGKSEEEISANVIEFLRAAKEGNKDLVESLILEIEVNATNPEGVSALHLASKNGQLEIVQWLLEHGANILHKDDEGKTPIFEAVQNGHTEIVALLLENDADPNSQLSTSRDTLLINAMRNGYIEIEKELINKGASIDLSNKEKFTPLMVASSKGNFESVSLLLGAGADPNISNINGDTALIEATRNSHFEVAKKLLGHVAFVNVTNAGGMTALQIAASKGDVDLVSLLLEHGANPNLSSILTGETPLLESTRNGHYKVVKELLARGANPDLTNLGGLTALYVACSKGDRVAVSLLLQWGADPNQSDLSGNSPLHMSASVGDSSIITSLLEAGADISPLNKESPSDYGSQHGPEIPKLIQEFQRISLESQRLTLAEIEKKIHPKRLKHAISINLKGNKLLHIPGFLAYCTPSTLKSCEMDVKNMPLSDQEIYKENDPGLLIAYAHLHLPYPQISQNLPFQPAFYHFNWKGLTSLDLSRNREWCTCSFLRQLNPAIEELILPEDHLLSKLILIRSFPKTHQLLNGLHSQHPFLELGPFDLSNEEADLLGRISLEHEFNPEDFWRSAVSVDLRESPRLTKLPLFLGYLSTELVQSIKVDFFPISGPELENDNQEREQKKRGKGKRKKKKERKQHEEKIRNVLQTMSFLLFGESLPSNTLSMSSIPLSPSALRYLPIQKYHTILFDGGDSACIGDFLLSLDPEKTQIVIPETSRLRPLCACRIFRKLYALLSKFKENPSSLNLSQLDLTDEEVNLFHLIEPDPLFWGQLTKVDLTGNPRLRTLPLFVGLLSRLKLKEILVDFEFGDLSLDLILSVWERLISLEMEMVESKEGESEITLDLSGLGLTDEMVSLLPIQFFPTLNIDHVDVRNNPDLTLIPPPLGFLNPGKIASFHIDYDQLEGLDRQYLDEAISGTHNFVDLFEYLKLAWEGDLVPVKEVKLMLVGSSHAGKTSLRKWIMTQDIHSQKPKKNYRNSRQLVRHGKVLARTDGIDLVTVTLDNEIRYHIWDFGGHRVYRFTHQLFYQSHAIYLLLFDVNRSVENNLADLEHWIQEIISRVAENSSKQNSGGGSKNKNWAFRIYLVGSHCDRARDLDQIWTRCWSIVKRLTSRFEKKASIHKEPLLLSIPASIGLDKLISILKKDASAFLQKAPASIERIRATCLDIPHNLVELSVLRERDREFSEGEESRDDIIVGKKRGDTDDVPPFLGWEEFSNRVRSLARKLRTPGLENIQTQKIIANSLEMLGAVCLLRSHIPNTPPLALILRPQWITRLIASIVTSQHNLVRADGFLEHRYLPKIWTKEKGMGVEWHQTFLRLLHQMDVLIPMDQQASLVPCLLPESISDCEISFLGRVGRKRGPSLSNLKRNTHGEMRLRREIWLVDIASVHESLIPRMICRVGTHFRLIKQWRTGMIGLAPKCIFRISLEKKRPYRGLVGSIRPLLLISLEIRSNEEERGGAKYREEDPSSSEWDYQKTKTLRSLMAIVENLLSSFYFLESVTVIPCLSPKCYISYPNQLIDALNKTQEKVKCRPRGRHSLSIYSICPDVFFLDVELSSQTKFVLDFEKDIDWSEKRELGKGAFGSVFLAHLKISSASTEKRDDRDEKEKEEEKEEKEEKGEKEEKEEKEGTPVVERRAVAVKLLKSEHEKLQKREEEFFGFQREAWVMTTLHHPNIVRLIGVSLSPCALVMELLLGGDLFSFLNDPLGLKALFDSHVIGISEDDREEIPLEEKGLIQRADWVNIAKRTNGEVPSLLSFDESISSPPFQKMFSLIELWKSRVGEKESEIVDETWERLMQELRVYYEVEPSPRIQELTDRFLSLYHSHLDRICRMEREKFWPIRLRIALDIASGMAFAHQQKDSLLHRDLKSPNIFLKLNLLERPSSFSPLSKKDCEAVAAVADFGLSTRLFGLNLRVLKGSGSLLDQINPLWVAPEVLAGSEYTMKSDVYPMGLIMWELLTRQPPFSNVEFRVMEMQLPQYILEGGRPSLPEKLLISSPPGFVKLMQDCWDPNPDKRPFFKEVVERLVNVAHAMYPDEFERESFSFFSSSKSSPSFLSSSAPTSPVSTHLSSPSSSSLSSPPSSSLSSPPSSPLSSPPSSPPSSPYWDAFLPSLSPPAPPTRQYSSSRSCSLSFPTVFSPSSPLSISLISLNPPPLPPPVSRLSSTEDSPSGLLNRTLNHTNEKTLDNPRASILLASPSHRPSSSVIFDPYLCCFCRKVPERFQFGYWNGYETCSFCHRPGCPKCLVKQRTDMKIICSLCFTEPPSEVGGEKQSKLRIESLCEVNGAIWVGTRDGLLGAASPSLLSVVWSHLSDSHPQTIRCVAHHSIGRSTVSSGRVWSGCDGGVLKVWQARLVDVNDLFGESLFGQMMIVERNQIKQTMWVTVEDGLLSWYADRLCGAPTGTVCVHCSLHDKLPYTKSNCTFEHLVFIRMENSTVIVRYGDGSEIFFSRWSGDEQQVSAKSDSSQEETGLKLIDDEDEEGDLLIASFEYGGDPKDLYLILHRLFYSSWKCCLSHFENGPGLSLGLQLVPLTSHCLPGAQVVASSEKQSSNFLPTPIYSLSPIRASVWTASGDLIVREWQLDDVAGRTGRRHAPYQIVELRSVRIQAPVVQMVEFGERDILAACGSQILKFSQKTMLEVGGDQNSEMSLVGSSGNELGMSVLEIQDQDEENENRSLLSSPSPSIAGFGVVIAFLEGGAPKAQCVEEGLQRNDSIGSTFGSLSKKLVVPWVDGLPRSHQIDLSDEDERLLHSEKLILSVDQTGLVLVWNEKSSKPVSRFELNLDWTVRSIFSVEGTQIWLVGSSHLSLLSFDQRKRLFVHQQIKRPDCGEMRAVVGTENRFCVASRMQPTLSFYPRFLFEGDPQEFPLHFSG